MTLAIALQLAIRMRLGRSPGPSIVRLSLSYPLGWPAKTFYIFSHSCTSAYGTALNVLQNMMLAYEPKHLHRVHALSCQRFHEGSP